ncbi:MAG TPA: DUF3142 domain-containing protein, partial [Pyrinomonadaceae bacterium]|nr:DUF3142 domain-containing protein [Pyrinomonadaceae bacterium]
MRHLRAPKRKRLLLALLGLVPLAAAFAGWLLPAAVGTRPAPTHNSSTALEEFPRVVLWAWERPERLDFVDPREAGVAFLARTLRLRGDEVSVHRRAQPLKVAAGVKLMAVVRVESDRSQTPHMSPAQRAAAVAAVVEVFDTPSLRAVQIDFDATVSERDFYREFLHDLRRRSPARLALSITALASWCTYDDWLEGLPVDEAVPMLFRMGADERQVRARVEAGEPFRAPLCRQSLGVSTDEP